MSEQEGITVKKSENFSEWYNQVVLKSRMADYSKASGFVVFRPGSYEIWERIWAYLDVEFKKNRVRNAYFPVLIPESLLMKETEHVEGFTPEVAWVTQEGDTKLGERLAVRPTSETIMYDSYAKWIRSWRDLPLKINQWNAVVRMEFKDAKFFFRTREFLWQEGHTVFATKKEADEDVMWALNLYKKTYEELLAIPVEAGKKTESEKFAGAEYTTTVEATMPDGKVIQAATSHYLGQKFAKAFGISFLDEKGKKSTPHQNSWGFSTRSLGVMTAVHGDDKGLVLPPRVAPIQIAIVPIFVEGNKDKVMKEAKNLKEKLKNFRIELDEREYSPGWKFNDWELKGIPLRIEIGPKDIEKKQVIFVRRDNSKKEAVPIGKILTEAKKTLEDIQSSLFEKALKFYKEHKKTSKNYEEFKKLLDGNKVLVNWCGRKSCEEKVNEDTGAKTSCMPFEQKLFSSKCVVCDDTAKHVVYFARSY